MDEQTRKSPADTTNIDEAREIDLQGDDNTSLAPDLEEAYRFLAAIDPTTDQFTFQTFDDNKQRNDKAMAHIRHGTLEYHKAFLIRAQESGCGVFVTVQETNLNGRKNTDIVRIRALFQEDDGDGKPLPLEPHIVVESSPGKFHRYWRADGLSIDEFRGLQQGIIDHYGSDPAVKDQARVMRLPGFLHQKQTPRRVRLLMVNEFPPYSRDEVLRALPLVMRCQPITGEFGASAEPRIFEGDAMAKAREIVCREAARTHESPKLGRHGVIYQMGCYFRRDGLRLEPQDLGDLLRLFEDNMRLTDTSGRVVPMNWENESKALYDGYFSPSEQDWPLVDATALLSGAAGEDEPHQGIDTPNDDRQKAVLSARRAALRNDPPPTIARRIAKHWPSLKDEAESIAKAAHQWLGQYSVDKHIKQKGIAKRITTLERLNQRFGQLEVTGRPACAVHIPDRLFITLQDLRARVADEIVLAGVSTRGEPQFVAAFDAWHGDCRKRKFHEIVFTRKPIRPDQFNLFSDFGVKPSDAGEEGCRLILQHILEVVCAGDANAAKAFIHLVAWQLQHIGKPSRIITVLFSEQHQTGKGLILEHVLLPIFGAHGFMTHTEDTGLGRFNDTLRGRGYLFLDEAAFARNRQLADRIKGYAAAHTLAIEGKGLPVTQIPSGLNLYLATNHREIAHVEQADARFWILSVAEHRYGDHAYFADVLHEIENGGLSAFLGLLLVRDVSAFIPQRDVPRDNAALVQAKAASRNPVDVTCWLEECLDTGRFVGMLPTQPEPHDPPAWVKGEYVKTSDLLFAYRRWAQAMTAPYKQETAIKIFWGTLTAIGFKSHKRGNQSERHRWVPDPDEARKFLDALISGCLRA